jgi:uncharacterized membrane protein YphA (DoxX/SURF4 family)
VSHDLRRISLFAIAFLVLLRISIGWQFLYEGLWKHQSLKTADPWTSKGYLMNAQGPFRPYFRGMVDDPYDLNWLDHGHVKSQWERWQKKFASHYGLDDEQKKTLNEMLHGAESYEVPLSRLPKGKEEFISKYYGPTLPTVMGFRPGTQPEEPGTLYVKKGKELRPEYIVRLHGVAPREEEEEYHEAVDALWKKYNSTSAVYFKELENLLTNPEWTGEPTKDKDGNIVERPVGEIEIYKKMLAKYDQDYAAARWASDYDHLKAKQSEIQKRQADLIGPVKKLDAQLKEDAYKILTAEQRQMPPLKPEPTSLAVIDQRVMWSLMILGGLLIAGFFTRISALLGAFLVLSFYLANPPWPGIPAGPGPEHSFIIDKNLIEVIALLSLAFLPTGSWFGVDGIFRRLFSGEKRVKKPARSETQPAGKPIPVQR